jgi:dephospho-CoA kinase
MHIILLTGGIASGKSLAMKYFETLGVPCIDSDDVSKKISSDNGVAIPKIRQIFGEQSLIYDNKKQNYSMNRDYMRNLIFNDAQKKIELQNILHPLIRLHILQFLQSIKYIEQTYFHARNKSRPSYCLVVIPLYFNESKVFWDKIIQASVCIISNTESRIQRVANRGVDSQIAQKIITNQISDENYQKNCDYSILNLRSKEHLEQQIYRLHQTLSNLS